MNARTLPTHHGTRTLQATSLLLLFASRLFAASFEGFLGELPIWVDLDLPAQGGAVSGSYFYKKVGTPIPLKGTRTGPKVDLREFGKKDKATGFFACTLQVEGMVGQWGKKVGEGNHEVRLFKANPEWRKHAQGQSFKNLTLANGSSLEAEIRKYSEDGYTDHEVSYTFNRKNVLSVAVQWSSMRAYPNFGIDYFLFDLITKEEIKLWDEIDPKALPKLNKRLAPEIEAFLRDLRKDQTDSAWLDILELPPHKQDETGKALSDFFSKGPADESLEDRFNGSYVTEGGVIFTDAGHGYLGLPHAVEAMDRKLEISLSSQEFDAYLRPTSVLKILAKAP